MMAEWQPIKTAPKDGTKIIVYTRADGFVPWVSWDDQDEYEDEYSTGFWISEFIQWSGIPTHWMHFPDDPDFYG